MGRWRDDRTETVEPRAGNPVNLANPPSRTGSEKPTSSLAMSRQRQSDARARLQLLGGEASPTRAASDIRSAGRSVGWAALLFAGISWLVWSNGPAAAVLGMIAYYQGSRTLGLISIAMGGLAAIVYLILLPLYVLLG